MLFATLAAISLIGMQELYKAMRVHENQAGSLEIMGYAGAMVYYLSLIHILKAHIFRIDTSDEIRSCSFSEEESTIYKYMEEYDSENFVEISKKTAQELFTMMNQNIEIPPADLLVAEYQVDRHKYLAL